MNKPLKSIVTLAAATLGFAFAAPVLAIPSAGLEDSRLPWQVQTLEEIRNTIPAANAMRNTFPTAGYEDARMFAEVSTTNTERIARAHESLAQASVFPAGGGE